jgi:hypothetical protein
MQKIMGSTRERLLTSLIFVTIKRGRFGFRMPPESDPVIDVYRPILIAGDGEMLISQEALTEPFTCYLHILFS